MRMGELGFWWRSLGGATTTRAPLQAPAEVDVAIVGAGFTGLWTAYYLKRADPSLEVAVLERELAGYGPAGRNGGWVSGFFSGPPRVYERRGGAEGFLALQRAMFETGDEVGRFLAETEIEADHVTRRQWSVALNPARARRLEEEVASSRRRGLGETDLRELSAAELAQRVHVA